MAHLLLTCNATEQRPARWTLYKAPDRLSGKRFLLEETMSKAMQLINEHDVKWVDLRFTDTKGKQQHVTMPARDVNDDFF